jgi:hypothetical protein
MPNPPGPQTELIAPEKRQPSPEDELTPAERYALELFRTKRAAVVNARYIPADVADLAPSMQAQLLQLYLAGLTLPEIRERNPQLGLGQIVASAVDGRWVERRRKHLEDLFGRIQSEAQEAAASGVEFVALAMRATHKRIGDKLLRYLQTGDETDLDGTGVGGLAAYKALVDLLAKMTGQDQVKKVEKTVTHRHESAADVPVATVDGSDALAVMAAAKKAARKAQQE